MVALQMILNWVRRIRVSRYMMIGPDDESDGRAGRAAAAEEGKK